MEIKQRYQFNRLKNILDIVEESKFVMPKVQMRKYTTPCGTCSKMSAL